ncbi:DUF6247 family protein [Streptomyces sp. NPDC059552]|uniref:DUF6247 family protein n=1 Tax=Streptomyces sp. NPDC059552 TaxID=3346862 RepID=UPI0036A39355
MAPGRSLPGRSLPGGSAARCSFDRLRSPAAGIRCTDLSRGSRPPHSRAAALKTTRPQRRTAGAAPPPPPRTRPRPGCGRTPRPAPADRRAQRWAPAFEKEWAAALEETRRTLSLNTLYEVVHARQTRLAPAPAVNAFMASRRDRAGFMDTAELRGRRRR